MRSFSYQNRLAFNYIITTGTLILIVFLMIYQIVNLSVNQHINNDLRLELEKHTREIGVHDGKLIVLNPKEWQEREHNTVDVNPVFIQFIDKLGNVIEKSPNLKELTLSFDSKHFEEDFFESVLNGKPIRQAQKEILENGLLVGYLQVAMSLNDTQMILNNLKSVLWISYPIILLLIFIAARFIAAKSIQPVKEIIITANSITEKDLSTRIALPGNKDELFEMSKTINALLQRIENALLREKQFTSDASHEFRTPLAVIKGTLEVMIRKPRTQEEYEEKARFCVQEVDRLNEMIDELLLLARFEKHHLASKLQPIFISTLILESLVRFKNKIENKNIQIIQILDQDKPIYSDPQLLSIAINNILSNALKYSHSNGKVFIELKQNNHETILTIKDEGIGIDEKDMDSIFNPYFRSNPSHHLNVKGYGLGLPIVKKIATTLNIQYQIQSQVGVGTSFELRFR